MTVKSTDPQYATALDAGVMVPNPGAPGAIMTGARILERGDEVAITPEFIEATRNRFGDTVWPGIVTDEAAQVGRWGRVALVPGRLADNPELAAAIASEREQAAMERFRQADLDARRYGRRAVIVRVPADAGPEETRAAIEAAERR